MRAEGPRGRRPLYITSYRAAKGNELRGTVWAYSFESERVSTTQLFVFARAVRTWSQNKNPPLNF